eukprot:scaffold1793_cov173-Amphora_coffeaeformis.AAC.12
MTEPTTTITEKIPLTQFVVTSPSCPEITIHHLRALRSWIEVYWLPTQRRKNPLVEWNWTDGGDVLQVTSPTTTASATTTSIMESIQKQLITAMKKVQIEDLGDMNAMELYETIPLQDAQGRGREDLERMQKESNVHVEFAENQHVYLVGQKQKLSKKCITLRNVLSHYHWRLSGKD